MTVPSDWEWSPSGSLPSPVHRNLAQLEFGSYPYRLINEGTGRNPYVESVTGLTGYPQTRYRKVGTQLCLRIEDQCYTGECGSGDRGYQYEREQCYFESSPASGSSSNRCSGGRSGGQCTSGVICDPYGAGENAGPTVGYKDVSCDHGCNSTGDECSRCSDDDDCGYGFVCRDGACEEDGTRRI